MVALPWDLRLRGGDFDGVVFCSNSHEATLIAWRCGPVCEGHGTFKGDNPEIVLASAVAYRRTEVNVEQQIVLYDVGDAEPELEESRDERELVPTGAGETRAFARGLGRGVPVGLGVWLVLLGPALLGGLL